MISAVRNPTLPVAFREVSEDNSLAHVPRVCQPHEDVVSSLIFWCSFSDDDWRSLQGLRVVQAAISGRKCKAKGGQAGQNPTRAPDMQK